MKRHDEVDHIKKGKVRHLVMEKIYGKYAGRDDSCGRTNRDFFLFPKLKGLIKGTRFECVEAIMRSVTTELSDIPEEFF